VGKQFIKLSQNGLKRLI